MSGRPLQQVYLHLSERALDVDPFSDRGNGPTTSHEQHGRVHVRWLKKIQSAALVVERASTVVEGSHTVGAARTDKNYVSGSICCCEAITRTFTSLETVSSEHIGGQVHHRLVTMPENCAETYAECSLRV